MRRIFTLVIALLFVGAVFAQYRSSSPRIESKTGKTIVSNKSLKSPETVVFSEDFTGGMPATWTLIDNDGLTVDPGVAFMTAAWIVQQESTTNTNMMAISTSWYAPVGASDDWMITPVISTIPANAVLTWVGKTPDADYPDGYEVRVSTTGGTIADFSTVLLSVPGEAQAWTTHQVSLAAYANQNIQIAFRNNSNNMYLLFIDDVQVKTLEAVDVALLTPIAEPFGSMIPLSQSDFEFSCGLANFGSQAVTNSTLTVSTTGWTKTATIPSIAVADTITGNIVDTFSVPPTGLGNYDINFEIAANEDAIAANNTGTLSFEVTDGLYAQDFGTPDPTAGGIGFASGTVGSFGNLYQIKNTTNITGVSVYFDDDAAADGKTFSFSLYQISMTTGVIDSNAVVTSDVFTKTAAMCGAWNPFTVTSTEISEGYYLLVINQLDSFIALGFDSDPDGLLIYWSASFSAYSAVSNFGNGRLRMQTTGGTNHWTEPEGFGLLGNKEVVMYPNPANSILNICNAENSDVVVYDILGNIIFSTKTSSSLEIIDLSSYDSGTYFVKVIQGENVAKGKFSIVR